MIAKTNFFLNNLNKIVKLNIIFNWIKWNEINKNYLKLRGVDYNFWKGVALIK